MVRMPSLFISHGSPELAVRTSAAHTFLSGYAAQLPRPQAILVVSAHWETAVPAVSTGANPATVYDFGGFDPRLRQIRYAAPGAPEVAMRAAHLLVAGGFKVTADASHGWDHGVWVPLVLLYPAHDIPVAQVSIQPDADPAHHFRIGEALRPLRDDGIMIIASGAMTHNLRAFRGQLVDAPAPAWVSEFNEWMHQALTGGSRRDALGYRENAPHGADNHPEAEHILPLFAALGATDRDEPIARVHDSYEHGVLSMDVYRFG
jgi:4,5-DOPA dioxygenase extradiol